MKIGSVPYLNARPLVHALEHQPRPDVTLSYATPSVLIEQLLRGELDIAMASTFPMLEHPQLRLLPGLGVTATGPAWSVRLLSKVPIPEIRTLALDTSSRSTVVLARIILADAYGVTPTCLSLPPELSLMLAQADAAVLIGDIGLTVSGAGLIDLDLGEAWHALTGLPFYFAGWIGTRDAALQQAAPILYAACDYGLQHLPEIATEQAAHLQIPYDRCYDYLAKVMRYHTGPAEEAGLSEFRRRALQLGLVQAELA